MIANFLRPPQTVGEYAADALRAIGLVSVIVAATCWTLTDAGILAFSLPALLVPRFLGVRAWFDIVYCAIVLLAAWSNVLKLYTSVPGWDLVVHFAAGGILAAMLYMLLSHWAIVPRPGSAAFMSRVPIVIVTALGLAISAMWEMVEWLGYRFITEEISVAYEDTIADMALGGLGALAAGILVACVRLQRADVVTSSR